ncbi:MAG: hypothetical protein IKS48_12510 [Eubacterium sp.]|nr:hypothetical protein [Eubacterium sp.]
MRGINISKKHKKVVYVFFALLTLFVMLTFEVPKMPSTVSAKPFPKVTNEPIIKLQANMQSEGWMSVTSEVAGTTGRGLRLEALKAGVYNSRFSGGINVYVNGNTEQYSQSAKCGNMTDYCGTVGQSQPIMSMNLLLWGDIASLYSVEYRVYTTNEGWSSWFKNGGLAHGKNWQQIEAVEAKLVLQGVSSDRY